MTLPEHELNRVCHHGSVVDICPDTGCQQELSEMEDDYARQRWEEYAETGDDDMLDEAERSSLYV